nr:hypothetical protein Ade03nite_81570 [Actinoplanes derwentensis]
MWLRLWGVDSYRKAGLILMGRERTTIAEITDVTEASLATVPKVWIGRAEVWDRTRRRVKNLLRGRGYRGRSVLCVRSRSAVPRLVSPTSRTDHSSPRPVSPQPISSRPVLPSPTSISASRS